MPSEQNSRGKARHDCQGRFDSCQAGPAVNYCEEANDGTFWAGNCEYESMVNYCPFCGTKARKQAENTDGGTTWAGRDDTDLKGGS